MHENSINIEDIILNTLVPICKFVPWVESRDKHIFHITMHNSKTIYTTENEIFVNIFMMATKCWGKP